MYFLSKLVIFHGYVSFQGDILPNLNKVLHKRGPRLHTSNDFCLRLVPDWPPWPKWLKQWMEDWGKWEKNTGGKHVMFWRFDFVCTLRRSITVNHLILIRASIEIGRDTIGHCWMSGCSSLHFSSFDEPVTNHLLASKGTAAHFLFCLPFFLWQVCPKWILNHRFWILEFWWIL